MNANFLRLNWKDLTRGFVIATLTAAIAALATITQGGGLPTVLQFKIIGLSAVSAGVSYLIKNLLTNSQDQFLKLESSSPFQKDIPK